MDSKLPSVKTESVDQPDHSATASSNGTGGNNGGEIPFVVTNWLSNYVREQKKQVSNDAERKAALDKIANATNEIASAFFSLGAYGTTFHPSFGGSFTRQFEIRNASFSDMSRKWSGLPSTHLENLAHAVSLNGNNADEASHTPLRTNLLQAVCERTEHKEGRTVLDAIDVDESKDENPVQCSILQNPVLVSVASKPKTDEEEPVRLAEAPPDVTASVSLQSSYDDVARMTAETMRKFLELRLQVQSTDSEIKSLEHSIKNQEEKWKVLDARFRQVSNDPSVIASRKLELQDEIKAEKQGCERVATQLRRKISELKKNHATRNIELVKLRAEAYTLESKRKTVMTNFRDPLGTGGGSEKQKGSLMGSNYLLHSVLNRQHGMPRSRRRPLPSRSAIIDGPKPSQTASTKKALLSSRLSVGSNINSHLTYPVYCLRFDRTGRYFITGADDYLIKVFYLGAGRSCLKKNALDGSRLLRCNYGANLRGAVLVCSLRGHAGVINDIDVSSDNCFLATASVDGDVRVWGLRDGCPVAILRGHVGGANMVSWSTLTPYRLVTTGSDGFARVWDIRDACLKRYGSLVGKRPEYRLKLTASEKREDAKKGNNKTKLEAKIDTSGNMLPPLPMRDGTTVTSQAAVVGSPQAAPRSLVDSASRPAAPLPPPVPPLPGAQVAPAANGNGGSSNGNQNNGSQQDSAPPGQFVANDLLDEGVKLLKKYKHGTTGDDVGGPGTRSRRAAVNVICVARCPLGGHFITGSDDGICRVWREQEDSKVAIVDQRYTQHSTLGGTEAIRHGRQPDTGEPLMSLMGHISAITDLAYSYAGDRILSASQKDGVIRIWSIGSGGVWHVDSQDRGVTQIVIKLTNPTASAKTTQQVQRRVPGNSSRTETSKVSCDVAVWTHDDAYVVSSQSILVKQSGSEIQPGSQYLFLWDSRTGQCLMGFSGAHTMQCPVVIPHPNDSSLVCTAAADGYARLWDWETGRCVFTHKNKESTNQDSSNRNKLAGFLDGSWSSDGTMIVLTDDSGCITILDCAGENEEDASQAWMKDQYFANDYYELFYDRHGYCIERGSEQPPHLAPRGVRCNHAGAPWSDEVNEAFAKLMGPLPLPENACRWRREKIRAGTASIVANKGVPSGTRHNKIRRGVREFDPSSTIMVRASGHVDSAEKKSSRNIRSALGVGDAATRNDQASNGNARQSTRALSSNFRYLDYEDMIRRQGDPNDEEIIDSDDEEFEPVARSTANAQNSDESDDELVVDETEVETPRRLGGSRSHRSVATARARQQRAQRRARRRDDFIEIGSDDEMVVEYMSTNNTPSGPYMRDYNVAGHFWRAPANGRIRRKWLRRFESDTSYSGRKIYTPQIGDSVVYIPRAHFETVKEFPSLTPPWQRWPREAVWPVVRCLVRGIRYRFPYEDYFRAGVSRCTSIVAILTLEVTGIPELSVEREFPWPKPSFVEPSRRHLFELSLFENNNCEYIFPEGLYIGRLQALEASIREHGMQFQGISVHLYYSESQTNQEDVEMKEYDAVVLNLEDDEFHVDPSLNGSGFGIIKADCENFEDTWSPWEIVIDGSKSQRPSLTEAGKKYVLDHLNSQLRKDNIREYFGMPVNEVQYSDYNTMIEIEMNIMFIKRRLENNYYGSKLSVVSDLRLVRDNCVKYNTPANELSIIANRMVEEFESSVLSTEERRILISEEEFTKFLDEPQQTGIRHNTNRSASTSGADDHSTLQTYNLRHRAPSRGQSSLESLPGPMVTRQAMTRNEPSGNQRRTRSRDRHVGTADVLGRMARSGTGRRGGNASHESTVQGDENVPSSAGAPNEPEDEESSTRLVSSQFRIARARLDRSANRLRNDETAPTQTRRSARNTNRAASVANGWSHDNDDDNDDEDEASVENVPQSRRPTRAATRNGGRRTGARRPLAVDDYDEERNENSSDEESEPDVGKVSASRTRISTRNTRSNEAAQTQDVRSSPRTRRRTVAQKETESPTRRSTRMVSKPRGTYEEASDFESPEESSGGSESEEEPLPKRTRKKPVYTEPASDFDEEDSYGEERDEDDELDDELDDDVEDEPMRPPPRTSRKRRNVAPPRNNNKRTKRVPDLGLPSVPDWPEIDKKDITMVCNFMLEKIAEADEDGVFRVPVLETHPHLEDKYLEVVENPIDIRTIQEERVPEYQSIRELQQDLILMLENCVRFNGKRNKLSKYAMKLRERLNDLFQEACEDEDILLPRRWRR